MGKAKGPKRKQAPARKRLLLGNSGLVDKQSHRRKDGQVHHHLAELKGPRTGRSREQPPLFVAPRSTSSLYHLVRRSLGQQLLLPNKQGGRAKRRRKGDSLVPQPRSSEAVAIQTEYKAVDAREKAKKNAEEAQRKRGPVKLKLAPASANLRMPSEGGPSIASNSASMMEALLQSITDDPCPFQAPSAAPTSRPVRSARRKREGNSFAELGGDSGSDESETDEPWHWGVNSGLAGKNRKVGGLAFAPPSGFSGFSSISGAAFSGWSTEAGGGSGDTGSWNARAHVASDDDLDDPDL